MNKNVIKNSRVNEEYTLIKHPSGLDIYIFKMENYSTSYALFGTKYGSINTKFKTKNDADFITVPNGIAHYLEHKLFENEDCDVFSLYAKTGASGNAYTSFDKTAYLFSCSDNFYESLEILLKFVQDPYFTKENVDKERGIISQEIRMYEDNPSWKVFFNMLSCLYHNHPVKIDIAGTDETIAQIDAELLYKCYYTFYNLNNMVLSISGDVDVDKINELCDKLLKPNENIELENDFMDEPSSIYKTEAVEALEVAIPLFNIGIKCDPLEEIEMLTADIEFEIALSLFCGQGSDFYKKMYDEGIINSSFETEVFCGSGYFSLIFSGESRNPRLVKDRIIEEILRVKAQGLDRENFEIEKKSYYGSRIYSLNNSEAVASIMLNNAMENTDIFDGFEIVANCTYEDVLERFNSIEIANTVISIVEPINKKEEV